MRQEYKDFMCEIYGLTEMPTPVDNHPFILDDHDKNIKEANRIKSSCKNMGDYKFGNQSYRIFFEDTDNNNVYYLINDGIISEIVMEYSYDDINTPIDGIVNQSIWNHRRYKGLARIFYEDYILSKYPLIISDCALTGMGFQFWAAVFDDVVLKNKTHKMYVADFKTGKVIKDINERRDMNEFYKDGMTNYRFILKKEHPTH